jgi:MFS family permease
VLRKHPRAVLITAGLRLVQPALYSILTVYTLSYLATNRGDSGVALTSVLIVSALSLLTTPLWGWISDRVGRRRLTIASAAGIGILIWPFFAFLDSGPLLLLPLVFALGMNVFHDSIYGPQAAWFAEQFPTGVRYSGVSLGYQVGSIFSVGLTPLLAVLFLQWGNGSPWILCAYIGFYAVLTITAAFFAKDPARDAIDARRAEERNAGSASDAVHPAVAVAGAANADERVVSRPQSVRRDNARRASEMDPPCCSRCALTSAAVMPSGRRPTPVGSPRIGRPDRKAPAIDARRSSDPRVRCPFTQRAIPTTPTTRLPITRIVFHRVM